VLLRILVALLPPLLLAACTPGTLSNGPSATHLQSESLPRPVGTIPAPIQQSPSLPRPRPPVKTETYSVVVNNVNVHDLLFALARDARLNVDIHPGLTGSVTLNAIDQTLPQLLTRIAKQVDMRFELDGPNLAVMPDTPYLKNYTVDYFNISRDVTGTVSTNTQIATSTASGTGGGSSTNTSRIQIENKSKNRFWESLEKNLKELLHETDKIFPEGSTETVTEQAAAQSTTGTGAPAPKTIAARGSQILASIAGSPNPATLQNSGATVVKRMTFREAASVIANPEGGVITVRATSRQHEKVQEFLDRVMNSARRQVLIEATIIEVELSDGYQQGIEWGRLSSATNGQIKAPSLAANVSTSSVSPYVVKYDSQLGALGILATVELLRSFGTVKVLSSPKLTVLNNQTATIKVAEDFVYFSVKQDASTAAVTGGGSTTFTRSATTTTPQSVAIGFFMSLTAQISDNGTVTLNVRPTISSIVELKQDPHPDLTLPNYVPQIRTREIESMLRVDSGDIAILGGLMEDRLENRNGRIPLLGDIPLFGEVFNKRANAAKKSELVVVLRPTVIRDASLQGDFSHMKDAVPRKDFFNTDPVYQPFVLPAQSPETAR